MIDQQQEKPIVFIFSLILTTNLKVYVKAIYYVNKNKVSAQWFFYCYAFFVNGT